MRWLCVLLLSVLTVLCVFGASDQESPNCSGKAIDGLRCQWLVPELTTTTARPPALALVVENASDTIIEWEFSGVYMAIDCGLRKSKLVAEGCLMVTDSGSAWMTEKEVKESSDVGRQFSRGSNARMGRYYKFEPGGRLTIIIPIPWRFHDWFIVGEHKIYAEVPRRAGYRSVLYTIQENHILCNPLIVKVTK